MVSKKWRNTVVNVISISRYLSSVEFYDTLLKQVLFLKQYHRSDNPIVLDFSETKKIEPLVISNLLCLGKYVLRETGTQMNVRIPETIQAGKLKFYLNEIGFTNLAFNKIYTFENSPYNGMEGKQLDPLCGCLHFPSDLTKSEIINGINGYVAPFTNKYLNNYLEFSQEEEIYVNKIDHFLYEIIDNCRKHGESDSFMTIHARYSDRTIYIAVSDLGVGFFNSWDKREKDEADKKAESYVLKGKTPSNELEGILCGIYKRKESKIYGLYNIIVQTLGLNGTIRIHSNDIQMIFTPRLFKFMDNPLTLMDGKFYKYNVKRNIQFKGVHVEMEIPF